MKISYDDRTILKNAENILQYCCVSQDTCSNCPLKNSCDELENHSIPYFLHDITESLEYETEVQNMAPVSLTADEKNNLQKVTNVICNICINTLCEDCPFNSICDQEIYKDNTIATHLQIIRDKIMTGRSTIRKKETKI